MLGIDYVYSTSDSPGGGLFGLDGEKLATSDHDVLHVMGVVGVGRWPGRLGSASAHRPWVKRHSSVYAYVTEATKHKNTPPAKHTWSQPHGVWQGQAP